MSSPTPLNAVAPAQQNTNIQSYFTPNLPSWIIPIFGSILTIVIADTFQWTYPAIIIGLLGIVFLWLSQPYGSHP